MCVCVIQYNTHYVALIELTKCFEMSLVANWCCRENGERVLGKFLLIRFSINNAPALYYMLFRPMGFEDD